MCSSSLRHVSVCLRLCHCFPPSPALPPVLLRSRSVVSLTFATVPPPPSLDLPPSPPHPTTLSHVRLETESAPLPVHMWFPLSDFIIDGKKRVWRAAQTSSSTHQLFFVSPIFIIQPLEFYAPLIYLMLSLH